MPQLSANYHFERVHVPGFLGGVDTVAPERSFVRYICMSDIDSTHAIPPVLNILLCLLKLFACHVTHTDAAKRKGVNPRHDLLSRIVQSKRKKKQSQASGPWHKKILGKKEPNDIRLMIETLLSCISPLQPGRIAIAGDCFWRGTKWQLIL